MDTWVIHTFQHLWWSWLNMRKGCFFNTSALFFSSYLIFSYTTTHLVIAFFHYHPVISLDGWILCRLRLFLSVRFLIFSMIWTRDANTAGLGCIWQGNTCTDAIQNHAWIWKTELNLISAGHEEASRRQCWEKLPWWLRSLVCLVLKVCLTLPNSVSSFWSAISIRVFSLSSCSASVSVTLGAISVSLWWYRSLSTSDNIDSSSSLGLYNMVSELDKM